MRPPACLAGAFAWPASRAQVTSPAHPTSRAAVASRQDRKPPRPALATVFRQHADCAIDTNRAGRLRNRQVRLSAFQLRGSSHFRRSSMITEISSAFRMRNFHQERGRYPAPPEMGRAAPRLLRAGPGSVSRRKSASALRRETRRAALAVGALETGERIAPPTMLRVTTEHSWRCRESNPGPSVPHQGFSERSLHLLFSAPAITQARRRRAQPLLDVLARPVAGPASKPSS